MSTLQAMASGILSNTGLWKGNSLEESIVQLAKKKDMAERKVSPPPRGGAGGGAALFCPMIDARRMEVYTALYDSDNKPVCQISAQIIDKTSFKEVLEKNTVVFFGDGAEKCRKALSQNENAVFLDDITPSAKNMIQLSNKAFNENQIGRAHV